MNNKRLGTEFEREVCEILKKDGYWVHFMTPDASGAQPFDIIAAKFDHAVAIDCKTSQSHIFRLDRLEDNQIMAFDKWLECGNNSPILFVKHKNKIRIVPYRSLECAGKLYLESCTEYSKDRFYWEYVSA